MLPSVLVLRLLLSQGEPEATPAAEPAPPAATRTPAAAEPAGVPAARGRLSPEELQRQLDRIRKLPPAEQAEGLEELHLRLSTPLDPKAPKAATPMPEADQARLVARLFFEDLISGDARGMTLLAGYPFQLEDRRLEMPEELHKEWLRNLRAKRTDLYTLYGVEVFTPAEMEKKYGRPPPRLQALTRVAGKAYIAVGNLSGHPALAVVRSSGPTTPWQVVGFSD